MTTKDIRIAITLPPEDKEWVDAQAEDIGVNAVMWIRMMIRAARKGRATVAPVLPHMAPVERVITHEEINRKLLKQPGVYVPFNGPIPAEYDAQGNLIDPDAWRGPVDDPPDDPQASGIDVDAIIDSHVDSAEAAGLTAPPQQPYDAFAQRPGSATPIASARALHRPLPGNGLLAPAGSRIGP